MVRSVTELAGRRLVHVATTERGLAGLLGSPLEAAGAEGMEVIAVCAPGPAVDRLHGRGIRHVPLRPTDLSGPAGGTVRAGRSLVRLLTGLAADVVHTHGPGPGPLAARAAGVIGTVHSAHGPLVGPDDLLGQRLVAYGRERLSAVCSRFVLVRHPDDLALLARLRVPSDRLVLVGEGVDLARFRPRRTAADVARARAALGIGTSAVVVELVGQATPGGGRRGLSAVATRLRDLRPEVVLVVAGSPEDPADDPGEDAAGGRRDAVSHLGNVVLAGRRDDLEDLQAGIDLVVVSDRDRPSRSALHALAGGLPAVATATPAGRQLVDQGVNGLVVPADDVDALVAAIVELAGDPARRGAMGARSRIKAEAAYDVRHVSRATLDVYRRLPAGPSASGPGRHAPVP
jgi:glycosyltransferase involved in cell wall biosynthesis